MKARWLTIATLGFLLVCPAFAQNSWTTKATISVPFNFVVNGRTLSAGNYRIMTYSVANALLIQNVDNPGRRVFVLNRNVVVNPDEGIQKETKLLFVLNNGQHVLHQIGFAGDNHIHDIIHGADVVELMATR